jgi:hypothetical protein
MGSPPRRVRSARLTARGSSGHSHCLSLSDPPSAASTRGLSLVPRRAVARMPWVGTPDASPEPRPHGWCASAFPVGSAGRLLQYGSIAGLFIPFTGVPACDLPVYASPGTLPYPTQDSVPDCWLGFVRVVISDDWTFCACKAQLPHHRTSGSRIRRFGGFSQRREDRWRRGTPRPSKELPGRAMASAGLWLTRHGPWADLTVFQARSRLTPRRRSSRYRRRPHCCHR